MLYRGGQGDQRMTPVRIGFLEGFAAGFILLAIANAAQILNGSSSMPAHLGAWVDLTVQCPLAGLIFGLSLEASLPESRSPINPPADKS
jgi:hypothetical protein